MVVNFHCALPWGVSNVICSRSKPLVKNPQAISTIKCGHQELDISMMQNTKKAVEMTSPVSVSTQVYT